MKVESVMKITTKKKTTINMNLQEQKHYYGFAGLPNHWVDDKDRQYPDEFFDDKTYEDLNFDNFSDMDKMFGHENSLFGTRGLPVGHPKRTSKSFDQYNKTYGPMIVRVVKDNSLQEQTNRIKQMMGVNEHTDNIGLSFARRRFDTIDKLVNDYLEASSHAICDTDWDTYWGEIENVVTSGFYWEEIVGTKYDKKGWEQSVDAILDILKVHYYPKIKKLYDTECK